MPHCTTYQCLPVVASLALLLTASTASGQSLSPIEDDLSLREARRYRVWAEAMANSPTAGQGMDVTFYTLDLDLTGPRGTLRGSVTTEASVVGAPRTAVAVDLSSAITVDSVRMNVTSLAFAHAANVLTVTLPRSYVAGERITWTVFYRGMPSATGFGSYTDSLRTNGTRWVYTLSEPYGAREWWPCVDHPTDKADSVDIRMTVPAGYLAVTNGVLRASTTNGDGSVTVHWAHRYPIATYLVAINVAPFTTFSDWYRYSPTDSLEVVNYVQPDHLTRRPASRAAAALTPRMFEVFEEMFGPYPFRSEGYGHVEFGWGGGMEHQTLTSLGIAAFNEGTIAHELAHQWFGDLITCRTWPDLWLNEGFATYSDALFRERHYGRTALLQNMLSRAPGARAAWGTLIVQDTTSVGNLFASSRVYSKGAWVLHMLRHVVGDSLFFRTVRAYADDPSLRFSTASTEDLQRVFETVSGRDLDFFFDQWVRGERYPSYVYSMEVVQQGSQSLTTVRIQQSTGTSNPDLFRMPLDLRFVGAGLDTLVSVWNDSSDQSWQFTLYGLPDSVTLDPDNWILKSALRVPPTYVFDGSMPTTVEIASNYPNPFNGSTTIRIAIPERGHVRLEVFDVAGRKVATLADQLMERGRPEFHWTYQGSSGMYICRLLFTTVEGTLSVSRSMIYQK